MQANLHSFFFPERQSEGGNGCELWFKVVDVAPRANCCNLFCPVQCHRRSFQQCRWTLLASISWLPWLFSLSSKLLVDTSVSLSYSWLSYSGRGWSAIQCSLTSWLPGSSIRHHSAFCGLSFFRSSQPLLITVFLGCISESSLALSLQMLYAYFRRPRYMEQRSCERYFGLCSLKRVNIVLVHRTPTAGLSFVLNVSPVNPYCSHSQF